MALIPFGAVTVPIPGTPVQMTTKQQGLQSISVRALTDNTGRVYVGTKNMNKGTFEGVLMFLDKGEQIPMGNPLHQSTIQANQLYLDADTADDGVLFSGVA